MPGDQTVHAVAFTNKVMYTPPRSLIGLFLGEAGEVIAFDE
jgi:hypothetical protein